VADGVRQGLAGAGEVVLRRCAEVTTVDDVDAVVLGSGVYFGHWLEGARELLLRCAIGLWERPVWIFSSGPLGSPAHPDRLLHVEDVLLQVDEVQRLTAAREHRVFGGRLDPALLDLPERAVVTALGGHTGDHRDLDAARVWGRGIAAAVLGGTAAEPVTR
jgi:menaquinone-dependent protoporphyrinogen oxidase